MFGLVRAAHAFGRGSTASTNHLACAPWARSVSAATPSSSARMPECCRAAGTERRSPFFVVDDDEGTAWSLPTTSIAANAGTPIASRTNSTAGSGHHRERGQRPQAAFVVGEQQLVAPPDRRSECSAAFRFAARRIVQHVEPVVEAAGDLRDRQGLGARGGEFDRQRQPVE